MWILLTEKDVLQKGDMVVFERKDGSIGWEPLLPIFCGYSGFPPGAFRVSRELKGWEAVEWALRSEVLGNDKAGCETTPLFWDCECEKDYIHLSTKLLCAKCDGYACDQPDSRKAEVILMIINEGKTS